MKKITLSILTVAMMGIAATSAKAQTNYYVGKWDVLLKNLPQGDAHIKFTIADSAGHLKGIMVDTVAHKDVPLTKIEQTGDDITLYFTAQGYDVSLSLKKKDDDHATGSLMGMFDAVADRIKK